MHSVDSILRVGAASLLREADKDDIKKLKKGSPARKSMERERQEKAAEKKKDPQERRKALDKVQAKNQGKKPRRKKPEESDINKARKKRAKKGKAKSRGILRKRAGEAEKERLKRVRSFRKGKGRFRPKGPARTKDGKKKVDQVPSQLAHCMLAIRFKRRKSTKAAWNICRWSLTKHGYLKPPYSEKGKVPKATRQTRKGVRRSMQHSQEKKPLGGGVKGGGARKYDKFSRMFKAIEKDV
jgi:hypothetical protein